MIRSKKSCSLIFIILLFNIAFLPCLRALNPEIPDPPVNENEPVDESNEADTGGYVEIQNQVFVETLDVAGTPYTLNYTSRRAVGNRDMYTYRNRLWTTPPNNITAVTARLEIEEQIHEQPILLLPEAVFEYEWDGLYGGIVPVVGSRMAEITFTYFYSLDVEKDPDLNYYGFTPDSETQKSFGGYLKKISQCSIDTLFSLFVSQAHAEAAAVPGPKIGDPGGPPVEQRVPYGVVLPTVIEEPLQNKIIRQKALGVLAAKEQGLGGWTLSSHHAYDPVAKILHLGTGQFQEDAESLYSNKTAIVSDSGNWVYMFDENNLHVSTVNTMLGTTNLAFSYDSSDLLIEVEDAYGNITTIERDGSGKPTAIISPYNQRTDLSVDSEGDLVTLINPASETNSMRYADGGLLTNVVTRRGDTVTINYDSKGRVTSTIDAAGETRSFSLNRGVHEKEITVTDPEQRTTTYLTGFGGAGITRKTTTLPSGAEIITDSTADDLLETTTWYDGTTLAITNALDPRFGDQALKLESMVYTLPSGLASTVLVSRSAGLSDPDDPLSHTNLQSLITFNDKIYTVDFNVIDKEIEVMTPEGRIIKRTVDDLGRTTRIQPPGFLATDVAYDDDGRIHKLSQGSGAELREQYFEYGTDGFLKSITNSLGQTISFGSDLIGRVTNVVRPDSETVSFRYDRMSSPSGITPAGQPEHSFDYNPVYNPTNYTAPDVGGDRSIDYAWNGARQLTGVDFPDGRSINYTYNTNGNVKTVSWPENTVTTTYDAAGVLPTYISDTNNTYLDLTWDGSLLTGISHGSAISGTVSFEYNHDLDVKEIRFNGQGIDYGYDQDGLITNAGNFVITRSPVHALMTNATLGQIREHTGFNSLGERDVYSASFNAQSLLEFDEQYDAMGRVTNRLEIIQGETNIYAYTYDDVGRLHEVTTNGTLRSRYLYDANGNRTNALVDGNTVSASYDDQDRLLTYDNAQYQYNDHGTLTNKADGSETTDYVYDTRGSLLQVTIGTNVIDYTVDPLGRRIARTKNGVTTQRLVYQDFLKPIAELNADGSVASRFVYATRVNVPDYIVKGSDTYRVITDRLGSVRLVVHADTGTVAQRIDYDEWGNVLLDTNPGFQPFGYAGGLYDSDTGLVRFVFRDYDAQIGRWLTKDPILFNGGQMNLYLYVHGDPVNYFDLFGLAEESFVNIFIDAFTDMLTGAFEEIITNLIGGILGSPVNTIPPTVGPISTVAGGADVAAEGVLLFGRRAKGMQQIMDDMTYDTSQQTNVTEATDYWVRGQRPPEHLR